MKFWIFKWGKKGKVPTLNDLDHETLVKDKETGNLYGVKEDGSGVKQVVQYTASAAGSTPDPGVSTFLELTDTPESYEGQAGKVPVVNSEENLTEAQKDAINKKYEAKELAARRQAARRQYQADLAQAWVNMALSIGKAAVNAWPVPAIPMMAAAGIAGGAQIATIMRNKPSFYEGGDTGPGIGIEDSRGTVAGIVHANEYVIPEWMRGMPQVIAFERVMEGIRTGRQLASGGYVSAAPAGVVVNSPAPQVITQSDPALLAAINKLNSRLDGGIKTNFSIFDFDKFQQKVDDIESISSF